MKRNIFEKLAMCNSEEEVRRMLVGTGFHIVPKVMTPEIYEALESRYPWAVIPPGQVQEDWAAMLDASDRSALNALQITSMAIR